MQLKEELGLSHMTEEEFDQTIKALEADGLIIIGNDNGEPTYQVTPLGEEVFKHLDSEPEGRN